jgi:hypothetical protein
VYESLLLNIKRFQQPTQNTGQSAPKRAEAGVTDKMVLYSVDKPNEVWTLDGAQDLAALDKWIATVRPVMQQTGLQDEPDFYYLTD